MIELEPNELVLVKCQALAIPHNNFSGGGEGDLWVTDRRLIWERHWLSFPWWGSRRIDVRFTDIQDVDVRTVATFGQFRVRTPAGLLSLMPYRLTPLTVALLSTRIAQLLHRTLEEANRRSVE